MDLFSKYLACENIQLIDANEETKPSVIDSLQHFNYWEVSDMQGI